MTAIPAHASFAWVSVLPRTSCVPRVPVATDGAFADGFEIE
jgi:hypothetical protein